jgi:gamma-glutamylcyclotransferase (GGCT)/AIG2-like uncharacterized protein YtfP
VKYFAYGSNMLLRRLLARVPGARSLGRAVLRGHRLAWHKVNVDGSGKCDIVEEADSSVWGVLYEIDPGEKPGLDRAEGLGRGYSEKSVRVEHGEDEVDASTYYATSTDDSLLPYRWYRDIVLRGAEQNGLPEQYLEAIREEEAARDTDEARRIENGSLLLD